jgi:hypothetical protein
MDASADGHAVPAGEGDAEAQASVEAWYREHADLAPDPGGYAGDYAAVEQANAPAAAHDDGGTADQSMLDGPQEAPDTGQAYPSSDAAHGIAQEHASMSQEADYAAEAQYDAVPHAPVPDAQPEEHASGQPQSGEDEALLPADPAEQPPHGEPAYDEPAHGFTTGTVDSAGPQHADDDTTADMASSEQQLNISDEPGASAAPHMDVFSHYRALPLDGAA